MIKDYHMHPALLCTSEERFDAFVEQACRAGLEEICITDHMPLLCSTSADRIPHGQVAAYCRAVRALAEKYRGRISIRVGIEIDFHPSVRGEIERVLREGDFDYVLGSSHLHVIDGGEAVRRCAGRNAFASESIRNTEAAAASGYFDAIAHFDMFRWVFLKPDRYPLADDGYCEERHLEEIDRALDAVRAAGLRLEINPHLTGAAGTLEATYPSLPILRMALEKGLRFSFGSDAHRPAQVGERLAELRAHPLYGRAIAAWESEGSAVRRGAAASD